MNHEAARELTVRLLAGDLADVEVAALEEHFRCCAQCAGMSETVALLPLLYGHPDAEELVGYAVDREELEPTARARLQRHVDRCEACAEAVAATRAGLDELERSPLPRRAAPAARADRDATLERRLSEPARSGRWRWFAAGTTSGRAAATAAAATFALLAYPTYLGLWRLPQRVALLSAEAESLDWSGAVQRGYFSTYRNRDDEVERIRVRPGQPAVPLDVHLGPHEDPLGAVYRATISSADATPAWSLRLDGRELNRYADDTTTITLMVPSRRLPEGRYTLEVTRDGKTVLTSPLEVEKERER